MAKNAHVFPVYDAVVVGARCAGAATAMLLARAGARVLMVDREAPGTDTMSTHALMRGAVMQLSNWGLLDEVIAEGTPAVRRTRFQYGPEAIDLEIKQSHGVDALYAPRRCVLDAILVRAAAQAGVETRFGCSLTDVVRDGSGRVIGAVLTDRDGETREVRSRVVIGADGKRSTTARRVGARTLREARHTTACVYTYVEGLDLTEYRWCYGAAESTGFIPTNERAHCVFAAFAPEVYARDVRPNREAALMDALARLSPDLEDAVRAAKPVSQTIGFAGQKGYLRQAAGPGWALVGDAGYFKDPLTAHGITDALRDAEILARAVLAGTDGALEGYQRTRDALSAELFEITDAVARLDWSLDGIKALHLRLNRAMNEEQDWLQEFHSRRLLAA